MIKSNAPSLMDIAITVAIEAARAGGSVLKDYFQGVYQQRYKEDTSLQTSADLEAEQAIIMCIQRRFPDHNIDSEERGAVSPGASSYTWLIDPLDGTENFVLGIPYFSSSITLIEDKHPLLAVVYNPITDELYTAERGKGARLNRAPIHVSDVTTLKGSRCFFIPDFQTKRLPRTTRVRDSLYQHCRRVLDTWSPALDWCLVASGKTEMVVALCAKPIPADAGMLILEEAGGQITDFQGTPFAESKSGYLVGSNAKIHNQLLNVIKDSSQHDCDERGQY